MFHAPPLPVSIALFLASARTGIGREVLGILLLGGTMGLDSLAALTVYAAGLPLLDRLR